MSNNVSHVDNISLPVSKQLFTIMDIYSHQLAKVAERLRNRLQICT